MQRGMGIKQVGYCIVAGNCNRCCCAFDVLEVKVSGQPFLYVTVIGNKLFMCEAVEVEIFFLSPAKLDVSLDVAAELLPI